MKHTSKSHKSRKTQAKQPVKGDSLSAVGSTPPSALVPANRPSPPSKPEETGDTKPAANMDEAQARVDTGVPQEKPAQQQSWYRPPDSKARKLVDKIVVHRAAGRSDAEIAKLLKTTEQSIRQYVYLGKKNGWLDDEGEPIDLEAELAVNIDRKIVRNISATLDGQMTNWQTHEMTIAAAKGRRIFKSGEEGSAQALQLPVVAIQVVMPTLGAGDQMPEVREDQMGGVPAYVEGEVVDVEPGHNGRGANEGVPATR